MNLNICKLKIFQSSREQGGIQNVIKQSNYCKCMKQLYGRREGGKGALFQLIKLFPMGDGLTIPMPLQMCIGIKQFSKQVVEVGSQVSHCWNGMSHIHKQGEKTGVNHVIIRQSWRHWYEFIFRLINMHIITYRNICRCVHTGQYTDTYFLVLPESGPANNTTSVTTCQILVSSTFSQVKRSRTPWRNS